MTDREQVERRICELLATETHSMSLSNKLFSQETGLFGRLGTTEEERRIVARSPLFQQALRRLNELEGKELAEFSKIVEQAQAALPPDGYVFKLEQREGGWPRAISSKKTGQEP
jgi:hypothetical protein